MESVVSWHGLDGHPPVVSCGVLVPGWLLRELRGSGKNFNPSSLCAVDVAGRRFGA